MDEPNPQRGSRGLQSLPPDIHIPLVDSLYAESRSLLLGGITINTTILVTFVKTGQFPLLACAIVFALVMLGRGLDVRAYRRQREAITTSEAAGRWERRYVAGAAASVAILGMWSFFAFAVTDDAFTRLVSFASTIAYAIGITGRNFGNGRLVIAQIVCAWAPMTAGLIVYGDSYHWIFAALLIPFFLGLKFISDRMRGTLLNAVIATRDMSFLAKRFDTALNNMPHGLCMFDPERRIVVANGQLGRHLGLPPDLELKGMTPRRLVEGCVRAKMVAGINSEQVIRDLETRLSRTDCDDLFIELADGRTLALAFQPMEAGGMVVVVEDITERKTAEAKINHLARFDPLTGLPNRVVLKDRVDDVLAAKGEGLLHALHFIDLDQFKQVNDTLGHTRGDMLLQAVADRLRGLVRDCDVVARFGGDEFVVLQTPVANLEEVSSLARRILRQLGQSYDIDGHEIVVSASIGITMAPRDGKDADQLLKNADMALYRAKSDGRDTWRFFKPEMDADARARRSLELDLRNALDSDSFEVYFQPIVDLRTHRILSCEALLRWRHPERGMVSPAEFIPVAEEMGLIVEIGKQVLRKACMECRKWPVEVSVAVNLSPIQFARTNVPALIRETLSTTGLSAERLEVEITETTLLQDTKRTRAALEQLKRIGVRVSLDDFGTGYSSLSYLHNFPLHKVKIDRSFLQGVAANERMLTLLRGMARLSAELGLRVAVEGIETEQELALVSADGSVDEAQGYLFSRPVPGADIRKMLYGLPEQAVQVA